MGGALVVMVVEVEVVVVCDCLNAPRHSGGASLACRASPEP